MEEILKYLNNELDNNVKIKKFNAKEFVSLSLYNSYNFHLIEMLDTKYLLIKPLEEFTATKLLIHINIIREKTGYQIAILLENATPYKTKSLIAKKIPFIDINNQMYLPFMLLHLKNRKFPPTLNKHKEEKFSPTTQVIYLAILYLEKDTFEVKELEEMLKYNKMTISRATIDLKNKGLINSKKTGKTKRKEIFKIINKNDYYSIGKKYLSTHIKNVVYLKDLPKNIPVYKTGFTALADKTMLADNTNPQYAIYRLHEPLLNNLLVTQEQAMEENLPEIHIIKYDIGILADNNCVDDITLILGLKDLDERTKIAIDELMEVRKWYEE